MEQFENYLNIAYRYLTIRNRSEKEIREYLTRKKASAEIIERIIESLKEKKFLDDKAFARSWVLNRMRLKPKGKILLKIELRQKGIADEIIQSVLQETAEEVPDEVEQAKRLVSKKLQQLAGKSRQEIYQKAGGLLSRRGYSWETVKKAIDESLKEKN
jgi:regulatory protein